MGRRGEILLKTEEKIQELQEDSLSQLLMVESLINLTFLDIAFKRLPPRGLYRPEDDPSPTQTSTIQSTPPQETQIQSKLETEPEKNCQKFDTSRLDPSIS